MTWGLYIKVPVSVFLVRFCGRMPVLRMMMLISRSQFLYLGFNACIPPVFSPAGLHTSFIIATELNNRMPIVSSVAYIAKGTKS